ncbi:MAG: sulfite exporter TauE/SafE family protein, partial [Pseudomonas sp.]
MGAIELSLICLSLFSVALLFACVGQAGASGFIAVMALFSFAPESIKPAALILNILVSSVVALRFYRSEHFSWALLRPILMLSIPAAFVGGYLSLPTVIFNPLLGILLIVAALPLVLRNKAQDTQPRPLPAWGAGITGVGVGLLSGLTGMGGGVLLTPILIYCKWARVHQATALSA